MAFAINTNSVYFPFVSKKVFVANNQNLSNQSLIESLSTTEPESKTNIV